MRRLGVFIPGTLPGTAGGSGLEAKITQLAKARDGILAGSARLGIEPATKWTQPNRANPNHQAPPRLRSRTAPSTEAQSSPKVTRNVAPTQKSVALRTAANPRATNA